MNRSTVAVGAVIGFPRVTTAPSRRCAVVISAQSLILLSVGRFASLAMSSVRGRLVYRIEGGTVSRVTGERLPFALRVFRSEGPGVMDWSSVHFSTAKSRATLLRRVLRMFPQAVRESTV